MDPTKVSRAAMRSVNTESVYAQVTAGGFFITNPQEEDSRPPSRGCPTPEVKAEFTAALQTALKAINARNELTRQLSKAAREC